MVLSQGQQVTSGDMLRSEPSRQLHESGFTIIPGPLSVDSLTQLTTSYDEILTSASGPDFKVASTTTRMSDLLNYSAVFDNVFLYPPLLEAGSQLIGGPYKLSSFLGRTLRANTPPQQLHADLPRVSDDAPLLGFILMIDPFSERNGATRFIPGSHRWIDLPCHRLTDACAAHPGEILACGEPGSVILFNGAVWHGHTANITERERRSIQGCFVRRNVRSGFDFRNRLYPASIARMSPLARHLLALDERPL